MGWLGSAVDRVLGRAPLVPLSAYGGGAFYEGASLGRRFATMSAPASGPNTAILASGKTLADRTEALDRNEGFLRSGLEVLTIGVIGTGVMPRCEVKDATLQEAAHELWDRHMAEADADGVTDGYGLQALGIRAAFVGGDAFYRKRPRFADDRPLYMPAPFAVPMQYQLLEAAMLPRDKNEALTGGGKIIGGVEFGPFGNRVAYHMYREHPSELARFSGGFGSTELSRVPAENIFHLREVRRPGQVRGEPRCAATVLPAHDFHQGEDALQKSWNLQAVLSAFIEINDYDAATTSGWMPILTPAEQAAARQANTGTAQATLEPGDIPVLRPGQSIKPFSPPDVGATYETAQKLRLRRMSAALGVPYELLSKDLENVSYSSARIGLINFWAGCDALLWHTLVPQVLWPMWVTFFDTAVRAGRLPVRLSDYLAEPWKYLAVSWIPPKRPWVDPLKDAQGEILAIESGLTSRDESILSRGGIPERVDQSRKQSQDRADALGVRDAKAEGAATTTAGPRQTPPAVADEPQSDAEKRAAA